ncbi:redoxin domain-containing protein [Patescibacteria group bacterium]|nr:redoxin domain-containing protein [Patescibacteria group bacterium]
MKHKLLIIGSLVLVSMLGVLWFTGRSRTSSTGGQIQHSGNFVSQTEPIEPGNAGQDSEVLGVGQQRELAPDFTLESLDGTTITLAQYRGEKPVVLDFWASWCPNCQRDMPQLNRLYQEYQGQFEVIGINLQESRDKVEKYVQQKNISFPVVLDPDRQATYAYGVQYTNLHVLIDKAGVVVKVVPGDISESDIVSLLQS